MVIAHPDDEIFVSGTLCLLREGGFETHLLCVTDGSGSDSALLATLAQWSPPRDIRRLELQLSAKALGVSTVSLLDYPDASAPGWSGDCPWDQQALAADISKRIAELEPSLILTHGPQGGYGHPAHKQTFHSVMRAAQICGFSGSVYSFCGKASSLDYLWRYFDQPSDLLVDVREFVSRRAASLSYHQSQKDFFLKPIIPRTLRGGAGLLLGFGLSFSKRGRRRIPIVSAEGFFRRFPTEGLVLQRKPSATSEDFFRRHFEHDRRITHVGGAASPARAQPERQPHKAAARAGA